MPDSVGRRAVLNSVRLENQEYGVAHMHTLDTIARRRSCRDGLRALVTVTMVGSVLLGLAACTLFGNGVTTAPVLNIDAPVPSGSGLYSLQFAQDKSGVHWTLVRADAKTGKLQWQQAFPGNEPKITVSDGVIYAVSGLTMLALRGSDGATLWSTTLSDSGQTQSNTFVGVWAQPVVADGHVYLSIVDRRESLQHGRVVALRASDGTHLWSHAFDDFLHSNAAQPVAAGDGFVFVTSNGIHALHVADGSLAWQTQHTGVVQWLGGLVYVDEGPTALVALDEHTGALVWTLPCWKDTWSGIAPSPSGAQIYIECLEPNNASGASEGVFAFDTQQHQVLWKYHAFNFNATPVAAANLVFIPHGTVLDAVRASDGKRVWSLQAELPNAGPVALALIGDTLYVRMSLVFPHVYIFGCGTNCKQSYSLSALRPSDGAAYWRHYEPSGTVGLFAA